jgi:hypothetical protein
MKVTITVELLDLTNAVMACEIVAMSKEVPFAARRIYRESAERLEAEEGRLMDEGVNFAGEIERELGERL